MDQAVFNEAEFQRLREELAGFVLETVADHLVRDPAFIEKATETIANQLVDRIVSKLSELRADDEDARPAAVTDPLAQTLPAADAPAAPDERENLLPREDAAVARADPVKADWRVQAGFIAQAVSVLLMALVAAGMIWMILHWPDRQAVIPAGEASADFIDRDDTATTPAAELAPAYTPPSRATRTK